jgi:DME family drug/metabolite transporter
MRRLAVLPGVLLVAVAAALWGTDPILRKPIQALPATTIVFGEHVLLVALTLPLLAGALRALWGAGPRAVAAALVVGAGASGAATILFTEAIRRDFITAVVMQEAQPLVAVLAAGAILGERPRRRFGWFLAAGLAGLWLVNQPRPLDPSARGLAAVAEALAAATLWALGTVLGRYLGRSLRFDRIVALRFFFGLAATAIGVAVLGDRWYAGAHDSLWILALALVTGLLGLTLYYYGLRRTPAVMASLAELANPAVLALAGIYAYHEHLRGSQWAGFALIAAVVTLLPVQRRRAIVELGPRDARFEAAPASA